MSPVRLVTLAPGHFHAALIQKEMQPGIDPTVHVYGPLDTDLVAHLGRIAAFNSRPMNPTNWKTEIHAADNWSERFLRERPGNVAILSGRNRAKIDWMRLAVEAGMHVLADKPWIIEGDDLPKLKSVIEKANAAGLILHDMMTERHEITSILQREFINDRALFGEVLSGDAKEPAVVMESIHFLKKQVAGAPLRRPAWFFDIAQQGEALADVGTHLVDLVMWILFPDAPIDFDRDVRIMGAERWPTVLDRPQFQAITGLDDFPKEWSANLSSGRLPYFCNTRVVYTLRGIHVKLDVLWDYEAPAGGGDTHNATFRGTQSSVLVKQQGGQQPELVIVPQAGHESTVEAALTRRIDVLQANYAGISMRKSDGRFQIAIPAALRTSHETHFAEVTSEFLRLLKNPMLRPTWEMPRLLAKYATTTWGVARSRS